MRVCGENGIFVPGTAVRVMSLLVCIGNLKGSTQVSACSVPYCSPGGAPALHFASYAVFGLEGPSL